MSDVGIRMHRAPAPDSQGSMKGAGLPSTPHFACTCTLLLPTTSITTTSDAALEGHMKMLKRNLNIEQVILRSS